MQDPQEALEPVIDQKRQARARSYAWTRLRLRTLSLALSLAGLGVLGPLGAAAGLRNLVEQVAAIWPVQVAVFFATLAVAWFILTLPLTYLRGYVLPHRHGLSTQTLGAWLIDLVKGLGVAAVLGLLSIEALYAFLRLAPALWWLWAGLSYAVFAALLSTVMPIVILPLFFKLRPLTDPGMRQSILVLAEKAGTRIRDVCEINLSSKTVAANAAVIGMGRTRKIVLGDTLLQEFPTEEVEVVVAHELGHHVHRDLPRGLLVSAALTMVSFAISSLAMAAAVRYWHFAGVWDLGAFPVLALSLGVSNALGDLLNLAYSRHRESEADAFSLRLTRQARAFISSEVRLTNQNLGWFHPPSWLELLFYTHPAPWRRVAMGERFEARSQPQC